MTGNKGKINPGGKTCTIGFRGTEGYRKALQQAALDLTGRAKVQHLLEDALKYYFTVRGYTLREFSSDVNSSLAVARKKADPPAS